MTREHVKELFDRFLLGQCTTEEVESLIHVFSQPILASYLESLIENSLFAPSQDGYVEKSEKIDLLRARVLHRLPFGSSQSQLLDKENVEIRRSTAPTHVASTGRWLRVAAALILAMSAWLVYDSWRASIGESALSSIQPGRPSAVLKWSTGDAIQLSTDQRGIRMGDTIRYADGTQVSDQVQLVDTQLVVLEVPMGAEYFVVLSDGTKVWLNAGSTLKYPMHFSAKNREVQLSGEGFFEVARDSIRPFYVHSNRQTIEVLGTAFNFSDYKDEASVKTTLVNGSLRIRSNMEGAEKVLRPGEQSILIGTAVEIKEVDVQAFTAWKDGFFKFHKTPIEDILGQLARWYNVTMEVEGTPTKLLYSGRISRQASLGAVLKLIENTDSVQFRINDKERRVTLIY